MTIYTKFNITSNSILLLGILTFGFSIYKGYGWPILTSCVFLVLMGGWMKDRTPLVSFMQAITDLVSAWRKH